jgi:hypothetical protein
VQSHEHGALAYLVFSAFVSRPAYYFLTVCVLSYVVRIFVFAQ